MAKANTKATPTPSAAESIAVYVPADFVTEAHGFKISADDLATMTADAVAYLLDNGFGQSITDSAAMSKEAKKGKSDAELDKIVSDKRTKRYEAILAGAVGAVRGARGTTLDRLIKDVTLERVKERAKVKGVPMPKGKVLEAACAAFIARQGDDIRAEAEARLASAKASASVDVDW